MRVLFIFFLLSVTDAIAQNTMIYPTKSDKHIEITISKLIKTKLSINSNIEALDDRGDNLRLATIFNEDKTKSIPKIVAFVDTKIINQDKNGEVISQVISFFSTAEIKIKLEDRLKVLEWINTWNKNILPIRVQLANNKIITAKNLITTKKNPLNDQTILSSYLSVIQVWPAIIQSLEKSKLLLK